MAKFGSLTLAHSISALERRFLLMEQDSAP
jgi:hypothetical protein